MTRAKRIATVTITGRMALGLLAPAASAQNCLAQGIEIEPDEGGPTPGTAHPTCC
jgi:hypothetical protein